MLKDAIEMAFELVAAAIMFASLVGLASVATVMLHG
jgi:hypothetical protein